MLAPVLESELILLKTGLWTGPYIELGIGWALLFGMEYYEEWTLSIWLGPFYLWIRN